MKRCHPKKSVWAMRLYELVEKQNNKIQQKTKLLKQRDNLIKQLVATENTIVLTLLTKDIQPFNLSFHSLPRLNNVCFLGGFQLNSVSPDKFFACNPTSQTFMIFIHWKLITNFDKEESDWTVWLFNQDNRFGKWCVEHSFEFCHASQINWKLW